MQTNRFIRGAILASLFGTLLLTLQLEPAVYFFPWHTAGMIVLQVTIFLFALPFIRFPTGRLPLFFPALWGALFLWAVISVFWSTAPGTTLQHALTVFPTPGLTLLLVYCDRDPAATFWCFARGMTWFGTFLATVGLLLFLVGDPIVLSQWEGLQAVQMGPVRLAQAVHYLAGWSRISSLTGDPNTLALWLAFSLPCTGLLYVSKRLRPAGFICLAMVQKIALAFTLSRAGTGMALLGLALAYLFLGRDAGGKYMRALALIMVLVAALLFANEYLLFPPDGGGTSVLFNNSLGLREDAWRLARGAFFQNPFTGNGFGTAADFLQKAGLNLFHLHNVYFSILLESGLLGLVLFLIFWLGAMALAVWKCCRLSTAFPPGAALSDSTIALFGVMVLLLPLILHQVFETMLLRTNFHTLLWLYLAGFASHPRLG